MTAYVRTEVMKKQQSKGKIVSGLLFSPQAYLEVATGNCYCLTHNMPVLYKSIY